MKLSFNFETLEDPDNLYLEKFCELQEKISTFRTSYNINKIMISLYSSLDIVKELEEEYMFCKDLFLYHFKYDVVTLKYKICEVLEYIKLSGIQISDVDVNQLHEMIDLVFRHFVDDKTNKIYFEMNKLEFRAYKALFENKYNLALARYNRFKKYCNNNIFLKGKISKAEQEFSVCYDKIK